MMMSNLSADGSAPPASDAAASVISNPRRKRLFIADLFYLKRLFARRKFETNPFAAFSIQKCFRNRGHPTHPIVVEIDLVNAHDPVTCFGPIRLANRNVGSEADNVSRPAGRPNDLGSVQTFFELPNALIESRQLPFRVGIIASR